MEVGYCQYHCMAIAYAVFHYRLYDLLRNFLKKFVIFRTKISHILVVRQNLTGVYYGQTKIHLEAD